MLIKFQCLQFAGKVLQDSNYHKYYNILKNSTNILCTRLCGDVPGVKTSNGTSTSKAVQGKVLIPANMSQNIPGSYIMYQMELSSIYGGQKLRGIFPIFALESKTIICGFNGLWPKPESLFQWMFTSWTPKYDIYLCSKGFFIVQSDSKKYLDFIHNEGPWFWGRAGLFITPWFPEFDDTTMVVTSMPVWVRIISLHLPFWNQKVLEYIRNNLGKLKKNGPGNNK